MGFLQTVRSMAMGASLATRSAVAGSFLAPHVAFASEQEEVVEQVDFGTVDGFESHPVSWQSAPQVQPHQAHNDLTSSSIHGLSTRRFDEGIAVGKLPDSKIVATAREACDVYRTHFPIGKIGTVTFETLMMLGSRIMLAKVLKKLGVENPGNQGRKEMSEIFFKQPVLMLGVATVIAPLIEEIIFRGIPFAAFSALVMFFPDLAPYHWLVGVPAAIGFGAVHAKNVSVKNFPYMQTASGIFYWYLMAYHGLWAAVLAHAVSNGIASGLMIGTLELGAQRLRNIDPKDIKKPEEKAIYQMLWSARQKYKFCIFLQTVLEDQPDAKRERVAELLDHIRELPESELMERDFFHLFLDEVKTADDLIAALERLILYCEKHIDDLEHIPPKMKLAMEDLKFTPAEQFYFLNEMIRLGGKEWRSLSDLFTQFLVKEKARLESRRTSRISPYDIYVLKRKINEILRAAKSAEDFAENL